MSRPHQIVTDALGNEIKVPTTREAGDWQAVCKCGYICGGTFGYVPNDNDRKYVACPACGADGAPDIQWKELAP